MSAFDPKRTLIAQKSRTRQNGKAPAKHKSLPEPGTAARARRSCCQLFFLLQAPPPVTYHSVRSPGWLAANGPTWYQLSLLLSTLPSAPGEIRNNNQFENSRYPWFNDLSSPSWPSGHTNRVRRRHVRFWHLADLAHCTAHVRFWG